jgi:hypothetical protein
MCQRPVLCHSGKHPYYTANLYSVCNFLVILDSSKFFLIYGPNISNPIQCFPHDFFYPQYGCFNSHCFIISIISIFFFNFSVFSQYFLNKCSYFLKLFRLPSSDHPLLSTNYSGNTISWSTTTGAACLDDQLGLNQRREPTEAVADGPVRVACLNQAWRLTGHCRSQKP